MPCKSSKNPKKIGIIAYLVGSSRLSDIGGNIYKDNKGNIHSYNYDVYNMGVCKIYI